MKTIYIEYIQTVLQSVLDREKHQEIQDELMDHMQSIEEEITKNGLNPKEIESTVIMEMGSPEELGKSLNRIYGLNQKPLFLVGISSLFITGFNGFMMLNSENFKLSDWVLLILGFGISLFCVGVVVRMKKLLDQVRKERIYYAGHPKTYVEKLTDKVFVRGFGLFIIFVIVLGLLEYFSDGFESNLLVMMSVYVNNLFLTILYTSYPKMIFSENGVYFMRDLPGFVSWEVVDNYEWKQKFGEYELRLKNKGCFGKVHIRFSASEKERLDNFVKAR